MEINLDKEDLIMYSSTFYLSFYINLVYSSKFMFRDVIIIGSIFSTFFSKSKYVYKDGISVFILGCIFSDVCCKVLKV